MVYEIIVQSRTKDKVIRRRQFNIQSATSIQDAVWQLAHHPKKFDEARTLNYTEWRKSMNRR
jgi:hypothetical protein